jgi:CDP-diacylglycerol--glycerol-3-phosphate 3-phosphatidyltransferase
MEQMTSNTSDQPSYMSTSKIPYVIPSAVSAVRVLLAILLVTKVGSRPEEILVAAFLGVPIVFILDAVDGILARRLNSQTLAGSFIDIAADRLVEFLFLQHFVRAGLVPLWFILVFYGRIVLTDACRMRAFRMEKISAIGIHLPRPWRLFVLSKFSRSAYAALKGVFFSLLLLAMYRGDTSLSLLESGILVCVLVFSILRALPILITYFPRRIELINVKLRSNRCLKMHDVATNKRRAASLVQLAYDICLAVVLVMIAWHQ